MLVTISQIPGSACGALVADDGPKGRQNGGEDGHLLAEAGAFVGSMFNCMVVCAVHMEIVFGHRSSLGWWWQSAAGRNGQPPFAQAWKMAR